MPAKEARRQQAQTEVERLIREFDAWKEQHQNQRVEQSGDPRRQYDSQLDALETEVLSAARILRDHLNNVNVAAPAGDVFRECASTEQELLWLCRVWDYFRDKFDQRMDDTHGPTLRAADEVVWSCYRSSFRDLNKGRVPKPAPLPYIETDFSPSALRTDRKEVLARRGPDFKLTLDAFRQLPIPILKIPVTAISNPWSLVLIGHETGHIIQSSIAKDFPSRFAEAIVKVVPEEDASLWENWSAEIFADWYAVVTMGQWAVWAVAQFEIADRETMMKRRGPYPAALVRLKLSAEIAKGYGLPVQPVLDDLGLIFDIGNGDPPELQRDDAATVAVAQAIAEIPELKDMLGPVQFSASKYSMSRAGGLKGEVEEWSNFLETDGRDPQPPKTNVRSARMAAAGLAHAWNETAIRPQTPPVETDLEKLRTLARETIAAAAEPSVRSAVATPKTDKEPGRTLLEFFREARAT